MKMLQKSIVLLQSHDVHIKSVNNLPVQRVPVPTVLPVPQWLDRKTYCFCTVLIFLVPYFVKRKRTNFMFKITILSVWASVPDPKAGVFLEFHYFIWTLFFVRWQFESKADEELPIHKVRYIYKCRVPTSELGSPRPLPRKRVYPFPPESKGWVGTLACWWGGGGVPNPTTGEKA